MPRSVDKSDWVLQCVGSSHLIPLPPGVTHRDSAHLLAVGPDELLARVVRYVEETLTAANDSVMEARRDADSLSSRLTMFKRRCRQLYQGYRALRYKLADEWPTAAAGECANPDCCVWTASALPAGILMHAKKSSDRVDVLMIELV